MFPRWPPVLVSCLLLAGPAAAADELTVTAGAVTVVETNADIHTVMVAVPEIADATVTAPRRLILLGRKSGRTGLLVIGSDGATLVDATVMVAPADVGTVTVDRGTRETTLSCTPRCSEVAGSKAADNAAATPAQPVPTPAAAGNPVSVAPAGH